MWKLIDSGRKSASENMRLDEKFLEELDPEGEAILHLYGWEKPSATYGYFTKVDKFLSVQDADKYGLNLAKRPTGGGIIFHVADLAFSVLVPSEHEGFFDNTLDNYHYVNGKVLEAVKACMKDTELELLPTHLTSKDEACGYFCMAKPTIYDVMLGGKKIAGAAQRKKKQGFLHQGSIALALPKQEFLKKVLLPGTGVEAAMRAYTHTFLGDNWTDEALEEMRHVVTKQLKKIFLEGDK
jgi:lipoate-protein ligase A